MTESDPTDLAQEIADDAAALASIEREIAERGPADPDLVPLVLEAEDLTDDLLEDAERQSGD